MVMDTGTLNTHEEKIQKYYLVSHPIRNRIALAILNSGGDGVYASKLAGELGLKRELISFHLMKMEHAGIISSEFGLKNPPKDRPIAVRYYRLTRTGKEVIENLKKIL